jgi:glycosyltransferase involved in cell wall biosynthesis
MLLTRPLAAGLRWARRRRQLRDAANRMERARRAGLVDRQRTAGSYPRLRTRPGAALERGELGRAFVSIVTRSRIPFAEVLAESLARHHPEAQYHVFVTDAVDGEAVAVAGARARPAADLEVPHFAYLALALEAHHLCYVLKPFALDRLLGVAGYPQAIYLDVDVDVLAPLISVTNELEDADLVVTPHRLYVRPPWARAEHPPLAAIAVMGSLNGGIVGARAAAATREFLATWGDEITAPPALRAADPERLEQQVLSLAPSLMPSCRLLRDPAVNVAYWNLDERALGWGAGGNVSSASVLAKGEPLVAFHFSGYDPRRPERLSSFAPDSLLALHAPAAVLAADYQRRLDSRGAAAALGREYGFAMLPSGLRVDQRLRLAFRWHAEDLFGGEDPWSTAGEEAAMRRLFRPSSVAATLQPPLFEVLRRERPDLAPQWPAADLEPRELLPWLGAGGLDALGWRELFARYAPLRLRHDRIDEVLDGVESVVRPGEALADPLGVDRPELVRRLKASGKAALADQIATFTLEVFATSPISAALQIWMSREDLQLAFPDPTDVDAGAFESWLVLDGGPQHGLDGRALGAAWQERSRGRSLARIHCCLLRRGELASRHPLGLAGVEREPFARDLLRYARAHSEFDADDVLFYLFSSARWPAKGLAFARELPENRRESAGGVGTPATRVVVDSREGEAGEPPDVEPGQPAKACAVNVFGYFRSPTGLGVSTEGVVEALSRAGLEVRRNLLSNERIERDLTFADVADQYSDEASADLWLSYPHYHEDLLARHPRRDARTLKAVLLAWEQSQGHPRWKKTLAGFQRLAAVSSFSARSIESVVERPVMVVPNVVDVERLPPSPGKRAVRLDPERTSFLFCFDIASSFERKNPLAVIAAYERAFPRGAPVELVLKASGAEGEWHSGSRRRLEERAAACALPVRLRYDQLGRRQALELIAAADVYVSLHRSEGFGLTLAEAMAYGKPVVATGYSGNLDFMTEANAYLVEAREVEISWSEGPFRSGSVWGEPSIEDAARKLRMVVENPSEAARRGSAARQSIRAHCSPERAGGRLLELLGLARADRGGGRGQTGID